MRAVLEWLRLDMRRRARSLVVLTLLLSLSGALVLAVTAGARRDGSAMARLNAVGLPATAIVLPNTPGFDWKAVKALPEVEALALFPVSGLFAIEGVDSGDIGFLNSNPAGYVSIERGAVVQGRRIDNSAVDEVAVTQPFVDKYHLTVGDTLEARMFTRHQLHHINSDSPPPASAAKGPSQPLHIVGVLRVPWTFAFSGSDGAGVLTSYAFFHKYHRTMVIPGPFSYTNALVRLHGGEAALPGFIKDLARVTGRNDIDVTDLVQGAKRVTNATSFERDSLLLFAVIAAIAALLIVGQAIVRYTASAVTDLDVLRALGLTRGETVLAAVGGPVAVAAVAAVVSVAGAVAASPLFPIGVGRKVEPSPGVDVDWLVLVSGGILLLILVSLIAYVTAVSSLGRRGATGSYATSTVASWARRLGLPVPVTLGTRLALESGRGRTAVPARPAMVGAVAGVMGLVAAATFHSGLDDAVNTPQRYGQTWQAGGFLGLNGHDFVSAAKEKAKLAKLASLPEVAGVNDTRLLPVTIADQSLTLFELSPLGGGVTPVSLTGHEPRSNNEIALGPHTAELLHAHVGDKVMVKGAHTLPFTVSGITFVPAAIHNAYDEGAWVTGSAFKQLYPSGFFKFHLVLVRFRPGVAKAAGIKAANAATGFGFQQDSPPSDVINLRTVRALPTLMGVFLALLAIGAIGHALATAVYRRRHDIAVLRALGLTSPQVRATVAWQATTLAMVGLVFGIPLGLALARTLWRVVAERTPVVYVPPLALVAVFLVVPISLVVVNLLAAYPGHRAVGQRISTVLRAE
ncbi:MAG: putative transport system permease protein [Nocardioidaceae bacterium]|jgi:ABC-type lipoprotein release transport system permease subunit|nr:putative transport system permease protein [Nocardioidaceae bacterium]